MMCSDRHLLTWVLNFLYKPETVCGTELNLICKTANALEVHQSVPYVVIGYVCLI